MTLPLRTDAVAPSVDVWQSIKRRFRRKPATEGVNAISERFSDGSKDIRKHPHSLLKVSSRLFKRNAHQQTLLEPPAPSGPPTRLPPELWIIIFGHASALDSDPLDGTGQLSFLTMSTVRWTAYRRCTRTKLALSLVSRSFRQMSECILYETVWIRRAAQAKALAYTLLTYDLLYRTDSPGQHIRHLHIETPAFERCAPEDVRTILAYAPQLHAYTDNHSVARWRHDPAPNPASSPASLFALLTRPDNALRRLSWTTYSDEPFHFDMSPLFSRNRTCPRLEYLELSTCSAFDLPDRLVQSAASCSPPVSLLGLKALKVSLDNTTFMVLSTWSMPELRNLSVVSSDFSYAGDGFAAFFRAHGAQIQQLELGHSSSQISEQRLTPLPHGATNRLKLAEWLPNLKQFICSADAEWSWLEPDHIAPHVLLPAHPTLEFIAIRDIDARLRTDADAFVRHPPHLPAIDEDLSDPAPFFPLLEQLSSLLRDDAFPALRYMRDLSEESHRMRMKDPEPRIVRFWERVILRCSQKGVWCEGWDGVNVTMRGLKRASMRKQEDAKWNWF